MTVRIDANEKNLSLQVDGYIYQEYAQCLCAMVYSHAERGVKNMEIEIDATYYINQQGQRCLDEMKQLLEQRGLRVHMNRRQP